MCYFPAVIFLHNVYFLDDLYNTKTATTDLNWTTNPSQNGVSERNTD